MKGFVNNILANYSLIYKIFLYISSITAVVYLFPKAPTFGYEFQKGKLWQHENYKAPFDFAIEKTAEELALEKQQVKKTAKLFFSYQPEIYENSKKQFEEELTELFKNYEDKNQPQLRKKAFKIFENLYEKGIVTPNDLKDHENAKISVIKGKRVEQLSLKNIINTKELLPFLNKEIGKEPFLEIEYKIIDVLLNNAKPNIVFDNMFSEKNLQQRLNDISPAKGLVSKDEVVIYTGDVVEGNKLLKLNSIKSEFESKLWSESNYHWIVFGYTILVALVFFMMFLFMRKYTPTVYSNNNEVTFIFMNIILVILLVTLITRLNIAMVYVTPIIIMPIILKAFFDSRLGLFAHINTVLLLGFIVPNSFEFIFLQITAGIVTILTISELHKRSNLFLTVLQITLVYFIAFFAFSIIQEGNIDNIDWSKFGYLILNGVATLFVQPLIYIFEKIFGLVSDESLKELSNTNSKLLLKLAREAPGTFQHSLQVANLAEACANEIDANTMLVRTAALYHDIGKIENAAFFVENQVSSVNPHDELPPKESAEIIIGHVIKGVTLARKHKLPERIIDFIRTHHGTTTVYYFYHQEKEINEAVQKKGFQYPGPMPFSKETVILMICDSVEAATKSLKVPNSNTIDELVEKIVDGKIKDGQFMNANITFKQLQTIKKVLKDKLRSIYHLRLEYPE